MSEEEHRPMTAGEALALVQFAVRQCEGEPNWLIGLRTGAGPIVVAMAGEPDASVDHELVTDNVADAVNWLVATDTHPPDREDVSFLASGLVNLRRALLAFRDEDLDDLDALDRANDLAEMAEALLEPYNLSDDPPTEQEPLPFKGRERGPPSVSVPLTFIDGVHCPQRHGMTNADFVEAIQRHDAMGCETCRKENIRIAVGVQKAVKEPR